MLQSGIYAIVNEIANAIPPAYSEYIGKQLIQLLMNK